MWGLKNKINEQTKQKQTHRPREQTDGCQRDWVEEEKELKVPAEGNGTGQGCKVQPREAVGDVGTAVCGARWVQEIRGGGPFVS